MKFRRKQLPELHLRVDWNGASGSPERWTSWSGPRGERGGGGTSRSNFAGSDLADEGRRPRRPRGPDCSSDPITPRLLEPERLGTQCNEVLIMAALSGGPAGSRPKGRRQHFVLPLTSVPVVIPHFTDEDTVV